LALDAAYENDLQRSSPMRVSIQQALDPQERANDDEMDEMLCLTEDAKQEFLNVSSAVREAMIAKLVEAWRQRKCWFDGHEDPKQQAHLKVFAPWFLSAYSRAKQFENEEDGSLRMEPVLGEDEMETVVIVTHDEKCCKVSDKDEWCWVQEGNRHA